MPDPHVTTRFAPDGGLALATFCEKLGLKPELCSNADKTVRATFSRLARSTKLSKTESCGPPERRVIGPPGSTRADRTLSSEPKQNPTVLETFQKYRSVRWTVNCLISQDFHMRAAVGPRSLVVDKTKKSGFANQHEPGEPETPVRAAERIFPPARAPNLDKNSQFRHEPRRKMIG